MNNTVNKFLLAKDKISVPEMCLKQPGFTCSACGAFTKNKKRFKKIMQTGDRNYTYKNDLDKACFQHDMAYGKCKDLERRTQSDIALKDKAFAIADNKKMISKRISLMVYKFFDKKSNGTGIKNEIKQNQQLANELHKPIIQKF